MVLIGLVYNKFIENMLNFPTHVIHVRKQDVSNVSSIVFQHHYSRVNFNGSSTIDLTKLHSLSKPNIIIFEKRYTLIQFYKYI